MAKHETVGLMLIRRGLITRDQLYEALKLQRNNNRLLGTCLLELGFVKPDALLTVLADQLDVPSLPRGALKGADPKAVKMLPKALARRLRVVPYSFDGELIGLAVADGRALEHLYEVAEETGFSVGAYLVLEDELDQSLLEFYGPVGGVESIQENQQLSGRPRPVRVSPLREVPSREFGEALGLEPTSSPVLLERRKSPLDDADDSDGKTGATSLVDDSPVHIAQDPKDFSGISEATVKPFMEAIDDAFKAKDAAGVASSLASALLNDFDRILIFSNSQRRLVLLSYGGIKPERSAVSLEALPEVVAAMGRRNISFGVFVEDPRAEALSDLFGFEPGERCLFAPLGAEGVSWLVYADITDRNAPEDLHNVEIALKEAETAMTLLYGFR